MTSYINKFGLRLKVEMTADNDIDHTGKKNHYQSSLLNGNVRIVLSTRIDITAQELKILQMETETLLKKLEMEKLP